MSKNELLKYFKGKNSMMNLILAIVFLAVAVGAIAGGTGIIDIGLTGSNKTIAVSMGVLFAVGGLFSLTDVFGSKNIKQQIENLEKQGMLQELLNDFAHGTRFCGDKLIVGNTYVLGKGNSSGLGGFTRIDEIVRAYEYVHKTNGAENAHSIQAILKNGTQVGLGSVLGIEKNGGSVRDVFVALYQKNSDIEFGYK